MLQRNLVLAAARNAPGLQLAQGPRGSLGQQSCSACRSKCRRTLRSCITRFMRRFQVLPWSLCTIARLPPAATSASSDASALLSRSSSLVAGAVVR